MTIKRKKALVIGGSMAGLFAGNLLHRADWEVTILEKASVPLVSRGTGIATHPGLIKALLAAGAQFDPRTLGVDTDRRFFNTPAGEILAEMVVPQQMTTWARLLNALVQAFPAERYHLGQHVVQVEDGSACAPARVHLADGRVLQADLVVAADGNRSEVRRKLFQAPALSYSGYVAWRALTPRDKLSPAAQDFIRDGFGFQQVPGDQMVGYAVLSPENGQVGVNIVWYRRTEPERLRDILTDAKGVHHAEGIPPQLLRSDIVQWARDEAQRMLHPAWAEVVNRSPEVLVQAINDGWCDQMARHRVALVGDSAFVARPHVGQGVVKAAGDALAMVERLSANPDNVPQALREFSALRVPVGHLAVKMAQQMGAVIAPPTAEMTEWAHYFSDPVNLIRETAVEIPGVAHLA
jgi:2-polyprenyl-6-methoxyphenol hydroxylase-like FAD-dependent oxidoreductase